MTTIGVISCGELGAAFAKMFLAKGVNVVTSLEGRSERTRRMSEDAGVRVLPTLRDVAQNCDIALCLVHPDVAEMVAGRYLTYCEPGAPKGVFIDLNSVAPSTAVRISERFKSRSLSFIDAALVGPASCLTTSSTLYLCGERADELASLFEPDVRTKVLGTQIGEASSLKMLLGGMNKGLAALFLELALAAEAMNSIGSFIAEYRANYPAVMQLLDRMAPTYSQHSKRRGEEIRELEGMISSYGADPCVVAGVRAFIEKLAAMELEPTKSTESVIRQAYERSRGQLASQPARFSEIRRAAPLPSP